MKELTTSMTGIVQQLYEAQKNESIKNLFEALGPEDTAAMLLQLPEEMRVPIFHTLPKELAADTFAEMDSDDRDTFIRSFSGDELRQMISAAFDAMEDNTTEDMEIMAAITPSEKAYLDTSVWRVYLNRIPWLLLLMISATFTGLIITHFEDALASYIVLTAYIPMLMDTGGNCGSQASVTVIRSISLNEITFSDIFKVLWKESRVAILCGFTLAIVNFGKLLLFDRVGVAVAAVICLTLACAVFAAKLVGCTLPLFAKKIGFDPAVCASPFITTIVDALSLIIYFRFATSILGI